MMRDYILGLALFATGLCVELALLAAMGWRIFSTGW